MSEAWYAPRKVRCLVCDLPQQQWVEVNAAIWDGRTRVYDYVIAGLRAYTAQKGTTISREAMRRHVAHIEATWHTTPPTTREESVFPIDYDSMTDRAARMSAKAMRRLDERIGYLDDKDLIAVAKLGVDATAKRAAIQSKDRRHDHDLAALFGLASGMIGTALPPGEVIDVTPERVLIEELVAERKLLESNARGG